MATEYSIGYDRDEDGWWFIRGEPGYGEELSTHPTRDEAVEAGRNKLLEKGEGVVYIYEKDNERGLYDKKF